MERNDELERDLMSRGKISGRNGAHVVTVRMPPPVTINPAPVLPISLQVWLRSKAVSLAPSESDDDRL